jgi:hypothetical protein
MHHLIGYTVIASTGMDKDAGRVTKLPSSLVGEHRRKGVPFEVGGQESQVANGAWCVRGVK